MITGTRVGLSLSARQISKPSAPCGSIRSSSSRSGVNRFTDGERVVAAVARFDDEPFVLQVVAEQPGDRLVVFDDQDALGHLQHLVSGTVSCAVAAGRSAASRRLRFPRPRSLRTSIRPPWLSTMRFAIGRPRPLPLTDDVAAAIEAFEDARQVLAADPGSAIPDGQRHALGRRPCPSPPGAARSSEYLIALSTMLSSA